MRIKSAHTSKSLILTTFTDLKPKVGRRLTPKEKKYCALRAMGATQREAAEKCGGMRGNPAEQRGHRLEKRPEITATIEELKEKFGPTVYQKSVEAGLKALREASPKDVPKIIEVLGKITKGMREPELVERTTVKKLPPLPAHITITHVERPALEAAIQRPTEDSTEEAKPDNEESTT